MTAPTIADYRARPPHPARRQGGRGVLAGGGSPAGDLPAVTVVTAVRNDRRALEGTLESVFDQDYPAVEHVVVDGASTDGTVELLEAWGDRLALWLSEPDRGIYDAMNKGIALAGGDVVGLLNAGDRYLPGALRTVADAYREHGAGRIYYGDVVMRYAGLGVDLETAADLDALRYTSSLPHPSVFVPRPIYGEGLYDPRYRLAADYAFLAGQLFAGRRFHRLARPLALFVDDGVSNSWRGFVGCRRELVAFHREARSGHAFRTALYAGFEIVLRLAHDLLRPLVGERRAGRWKLAFFNWRRRRRGA